MLLLLLVVVVVVVVVVVRETQGAKANVVERLLRANRSVWV